MKSILASWERFRKEQFIEEGGKDEFLRRHAYYAGALDLFVHLMPLLKPEWRHRAEVELLLQELEEYLKPMTMNLEDLSEEAQHYVMMEVERTGESIDAALNKMLLTIARRNARETQ